MATKKTASERATSTGTTSQPAKKPTVRAKKQAAAPKAVRAKAPASAPKVVRAKKPATEVRAASAAPAMGQPMEKQPMGPDERRHLIAEAAYLRAEARGFAAGGEAEDWLLAEQEIDGRQRASVSG